MTDIVQGVNSTFQTPHHLSELEEQVRKLQAQVQTLEDYRKAMEGELEEVLGSPWD